LKTYRLAGYPPTSVIADAAYGSDDTEKESPPCLLIILIVRGFAISATLAKFSRNAPSNPPHPHEVHFTADGTDALHLQFTETFTFEHLIRLYASIL
jgi:hypothetical protein